MENEQHEVGRWEKAIDPLTKKEYRYKVYKNRFWTQQSKENWRSIARLEYYAQLFDKFKVFKEENPKDIAF